MINLINALIDLGDEMTTISSDWEKPILEAYSRNQWFTDSNIKSMLNSIARGYLQKDKLLTWANNYPVRSNPKNVALIMAGNIPLAGFHDLLCVLMSGHNALVKLSSQDQVLLPYIVQKMSKWYPAILQQVIFTDIIKKPDAIIATGSNNSSRYFEYYFGKYPNIIRKNRNSIAVITGNETDEELIRLSDDIFLYFGLGCRNISTLFMPENYPIDKIFSATHKYLHYLEHNKYKNNFDYHVALFLLQKIDFLTNNLVIMKNSAVLGTPVGVLNYIHYNNFDEVNNYILENTAHIQCVVSTKTINGFDTIALGQSQYPDLNDFADNINTMSFLQQV